MERQVINPWSWQDQHAFVQANQVSGASRTLLCAGQLSVDADGNPMNVGNAGAQISQALDNLETVLSKAGFRFSDVMRLNAYTTDLDGFFEHYEVLANRLHEKHCQAAITLLGVARLAFPGMVVELEATAMA